MSLGTRLSLALKIKTLAGWRHTSACTSIVREKMRGLRRLREARAAQETWARWHLCVCERKDSEFKQYRLGAGSGGDVTTQRDDGHTVAGCEGALRIRGAGLDGGGGQERRGARLFRDGEEELGGEVNTDDEDEVEVVEVVAVVEGEVVVAE